MPADPERLSRYPCFNALTKEQRRAVAQFGREECYYGQQILFREGEPGAQLYLLASGRVEILFNISEDGPARVDTVGEGDMLGCSALIEPHISMPPRPAASRKSRPWPWMLKRCGS